MDLTILLNGIKHWVAGLFNDVEASLEQKIEIPVTDEDNGKFARVVGGDWAAAEVETTTMTVTYDDDTTETFSIFVESAT